MKLYWNHHSAGHTVHSDHPIADFRCQMQYKSQILPSKRKTIWTWLNTIFHSLRSLRLPNTRTISIEMNISMCTPNVEVLANKNSGDSTNFQIDRRYCMHVFIDAEFIFVSLNIRSKMSIWFSCIRHNDAGSGMNVSLSIRKIGIGCFLVSFCHTYEVHIWHTRRSQSYTQ